MSWPDAITSTCADLACNLGYIWEVKVKVQLHPLFCGHRQFCDETVKPEKMTSGLSATVDVGMVLTKVWVGIGNLATSY